MTEVIEVAGTYPSNLQKKSAMEKRVKDLDLE